LLHLVGFFFKICTLMHGSTDIKFVMEVVCLSLCDLLFETKLLKNFIVNFKFDTCTKRCQIFKFDLEYKQKICIHTTKTCLCAFL
jgi:hypothetical protein